MPPLWTPAAKPLPYARGECTSSPQPRKGTKSRRDISSQGPGHTDRHQLHAVCKCLMRRHPNKCTPLKGYTQEPRLPTYPRLDTLTHTRQVEALELRCPGKVHGLHDMTTTGVETQPKARPKQGPRSPEPVLRLTCQPQRQLSMLPTQPAPLLSHERELLTPGGLRNNYIHSRGCFRMVTT